MLWLVLILLALGLWKMSDRLKSLDEIYSLAAQIASIISSIWGFLVAPSTVQIAISIVLLGWTFLCVPQAMKSRDRSAG